jgi:hypothetical protein
LGDPYNERSFWVETQRLLKRNGYCLFTTPSYDWAKLFRVDNDLQAAEFLIGDGELVEVPSFIYCVERQIELIRIAGLETTETARFTVSDLTAPVSPKLLVASKDTAIVEGYVVKKT